LTYQPIDTSDIDRWIGQPIGGEQLVEPVTATDVRRWVQAMRNPNPIHYDRDLAAEHKGGERVVPCSVRHGVFTANQGVLFGLAVLEMQAASQDGKVNTRGTVTVRLPAGS
jgi:acyl dehydratase